MLTSLAFLAKVMKSLNRNIDHVTRMNPLHNLTASHSEDFGSRFHVNFFVFDNLVFGFKE